MLLSFLLSLLSVSLCYGSSKENHLYPFLDYYEHIYYDEGELIHHHYRVQRSMYGPREIELNFKAFGKTFDLRLYPDDSYLHKDLTIKVNSKPYKGKTSFRSLLYSGYVINDPSAHVSGHLAFDTFDGAIYTSDEIYYIEPSSRYLSNSSSSSHSIIYRHSDLNTTLLNVHGRTPCGATTLNQQRKLYSIQAGSDHVISARQSSVRNSSLVRCTLRVEADYKFVTNVASGSDETSRMNSAIAVLRNLITTGSIIFQRTDFNFDNNADNIHFVVLEFNINTQAPTSGYQANDFIGVESFLNSFSTADYTRFCLSYIFTYRDFDGGVLGLAFVGSNSGFAGICARRSGTRTQNTGIVTLINFGRRVPIATSALTFTHEAGHNFGSGHDPSTSECSPGNSNGGKFVMFASANDGSMSNNDKFSPCSRRAMLTVLNINANRCFTTEGDNCKNLLIDDGEECDCGLNFNDMTGLCNSDPCCNGSICRLAMSNGASVDCSPQQGGCCLRNCSFRTLESNFTCFVEDECAFNQTCNGTSAACPTPEPIPSENNTAIPCNGGSNYCQNGMCTGSICVPLDLRDCECTQDGQKCDVCCELNGVCTSTILLANRNETARNLLPNGKGQNLQVGFPCDNFNGYCDFFYTCQPVQSQGALDRLRDFLGGQQLQNLINYVSKYWWAAIVGGVVLIVVLFFIVLACHCLLPRPEHMKKRGERRKSLRRSYSQRRRSRRIMRNAGSSDEYPMSGYHQPATVMQGYY